MKRMYDAVYKWKRNYASSGNEKLRREYKAKFDEAFGHLKKYVYGELEGADFFTKCAAHLDAYPDKFWKRFNGFLKDEDD
jgi:hypothetical protein